MPSDTEYAAVRVRRVRGDEDHDPWRSNLRAPRVGDEGVVVDVLSASGLEDLYVVECVDGGGATEWIAEFKKDDLEWLPAATEVESLPLVEPTLRSEAIALGPGDLVLARSDTISSGFRIPIGRCGVVAQPALEDAATCTVRFPLTVEGAHRLVTLDVPRSHVALKMESGLVLRDPRHPRGEASEGEWAELEKDELVSLGARLRVPVAVPPPHRFAGKVVAAGSLGHVVGCEERSRNRVLYRINVTLDDPSSYQGYRFTNLEVRREQFELVSPEETEGVRATLMKP